MSVTFIDNCPQALSGMRRAKARALEIIGGKAESYAKKLCPVDTGRLRNSITHQRFDENTEVIGTNVSYGVFVELGTHKMAAKPFLRPAAENHTEEYRNILKQVMQNA